MSFNSDEDDERLSLPGTPHQFTATKNGAFAPLPSVSGKCSKLSMSVKLDSTIYVAGGNLHGRLEIDSSSTLVRIGEISVCLVGKEEMNDREIGFGNRVFLTARMQFQGDNRKSKAVFGKADSLGYWASTKGKTGLFNIPSDAPSSFTFKNLASLKYSVSGVAKYSYNNRQDTMFTTKDALVVECWIGNPLPPPLPASANQSCKSLLGGHSNVSLTAVLEKSLFTSGSEVFVQVQVKNMSKNQVSSIYFNQIKGVNLQLKRKLLMLKATLDDADGLKVVDENIAKATFRDSNFSYDSGESRTCLLHIQIPPSLKSVRNTALAEICCSITVSVSLGLFNKPLKLELPIIVCNSASVQPPRNINTATNSHPAIFNRHEPESQYHSKEIAKRGERVSLAPNIPSRPNQARVLPWNEDASGNMIQVSPAMIEATEPDEYVSAQERSGMLGSYMQSFYQGLGSGDVYSFTEHSVLDFSLGPVDYSIRNLMKRNVPPQKIPVNDSNETIRYGIKNPILEDLDEWEK